MSEVAEMTATARHETAAARVQVLEQRARALQEKSPFELSDAEADELVRLERQLAAMQELLPSLQALARQEKAVVDVAALEDDWAPLMTQKQQAYDDLSQKIRAVWDQVETLAAIHAAQEALLAAIPDLAVQRYMMNTFWIDANTMKLRLAGNCYPPLAWTHFLTDPLGYRVGSGASLSANDPGVTMVPPAIITHVQNGTVFAERSHRG